MFEMSDFVLNHFITICVILYHFNFSCFVLLFIFKNNSYMYINIVVQV